LKSVKVLVCNLAMHPVKQPDVTFSYLCWLATLFGFL